MSNEEKIMWNLFYGSWFLFLDFPDGGVTQFAAFPGAKLCFVHNSRTSKQG